ncbi:MAG: hypothetical protein JXN61_03270 [Sedimentisphaerales bacterium]|nr:hypothetical protein [Sedimentisphaerales bacterium]
MSKPQPVLRRDALTKQENETNERAIRQGYPALPSQRERLYESYSDCRREYYHCREENLQTQDFLDLIDLKDAEAVFRLPTHVLRTQVEQSNYQYYTTWWGC